MRYFTGSDCIEIFGNGDGMNNLIDRQMAINALWKALFDYEDKTEKQFQESEELDIDDWISGHRSFVQNMNDIDRQTIFNLPLAKPKWTPITERLPEVKQKVLVQYADGSMVTKRCNDAGHLAWFYSNVVAWMPAPEPYKEGDAE